MRIPVLALVLALTLDARTGAAEPRSAVDPVGACQAAIALASRQLGDGLRRQIGKCIAAGVRCLTTEAADLDACCAAATPRCRAHEAKLARVSQRFANGLASGRCARIGFDTVLDPNGLGFASAAQTCRCLPTPTTVADLRSLGSCLARLVDGETTRLLAVAEAPRAAEALACVGLDRELAALQASESTGCDQPSPTATPSVASPGASVTPSAAATASRAPSVTAPTPTPTRTPRPRRTPTGGATATPIASTTAPTGNATPIIVATATATLGRTATATRTPPPTRTVVPMPTPTSTPVCGNGIVEGDEECDGNTFDTSTCLGDVCTCEDFCDDAGGRLACHRDCTADFSHCTAGGCEF